jgi:hypothetical protein
MAEVGPAEATGLGGEVGTAVGEASAGAEVGTADGAAPVGEAVG